MRGTTAATMAHTPLLPLTVSNECCNCGAILALRAAAKQHLRSAITIGYCHPRQTRRKYERRGPIIPSNSLYAKSFFNELDEYNSHIKLEFPFPRVLLTAVSNDSINDGDHG